MNLPGVGGKTGGGGGVLAPATGSGDPWEAVRENGKPLRRRSLLDPFALRNPVYSQPSACGADSAFCYSNGWDSAWPYELSRATKQVNVHQRHLFSDGETTICLPFRATSAWFELMLT
jgi:hypothetical protein